MSKKIVIFKRNQLLLCAILLIIATIIILVVSISGKNDSDDPVTLENARYVPGLYNSDIRLSEYTLNLELAVDRDCIKSVSITNLDEEILSMYPLIEPSLQAVSEQLIGGVAIDAVTISEDSKVIFVNDGSTDNTWGIIREQSEKNPCVIGISLARNYGHQNALLAGLSETVDKCDITISMDCDGQDDINAVDEMIKEYRNKAAMLIE